MMFDIRDIACDGYGLTAGTSMLNKMAKCSQKVCGSTAKAKQKSKPCDVVRGDVICTESCHGNIKRYGIALGEDVIFYGKNRQGKNSVQQIPLFDFLEGAEHFYVVNFPLPGYSLSSTHAATARRAESSLGTGGYKSSGHFVLWCKTGITQTSAHNDLKTLEEKVKVY